MIAIDPATGATLAEYPDHTDDQLEDCLVRAAEASTRLRALSFAERTARMLRVADILDREKHTFARLMTREMGKTLSSAVAEAEKCAWGCRYYAEHAPRFLAEEHVQTDAAISLIRYQPLGTVLAIMPWNFPFWQVFRFAAPAIMAGNTGLLKHASNVPGCALAIQDIFTRAGFEPGVFQTLLIGADRVDRVIDDPRISAVTLTGSEAAGSAVAARAGRRIKKTVLELGGSDPFIIMPTANLDQAVQTAVKARTINNGQSCIAAKRFIVHDAIYDRFVEAFVSGMRALVVGDPLDARTEVGPLATAAIRDQLHQQVLASLAAGATLLTGGHPLDRPGFYYAPAVLADIPRSAPAFHEELFGPVASVFRAADIDDAIRIANATPFGLGSAAWTNHLDEQELFIDRLEAGSVFINAMVASDPRLPFGGVKRSGYGRELSIFGIREFTNIKTVWIGAASGGDHETE